MTYKEYREWQNAVFQGAVEAERLDALERDRRLRDLHETLGVCHFHPHVRISTGGGTPMRDGPCWECEAAMGEPYEAR